MENVVLSAEEYHSLNQRVSSLQSELEAVKKEKTEMIVESGKIQIELKHKIYELKSQADKIAEGLKWTISVIKHNKGLQQDESVTQQLPEAELSLAPYQSTIHKQKLK